MALSITPETQFAPLPKTPEGHVVGLWEQTSAAFMNNTFTGSFAQRATNEHDNRSAIPVDPNFQLEQHLTPDEMAQPSRFADVGSVDELAVVREQKARYDRRNETLAAGPVNPLLLSLAVNFADPVNYVGLGAVTGGTTLAKVGVAAAENGFLSGAAVGLQSSFDPETSVQDAVVATAAGATIGAVFKGAASLVAGKGSTPMAKLHEVGTETAGLMNDKRTVIEAKSLSAAANISDITPEMTQQVRSLRFGTKTGNVGIVPVAEELGKSDLTSARSLIHQMYDLGTVTNGEFRGERVAGPSLRTQNLADDGMLSKLHVGIKTAYTDGIRSGDIPRDMSFEQFDSELGRALNMGDTSPIKSVEDAAKAIRKNILDETKKEIERVGLIDIPGVVKGAQTYFPHVHNTHAIENGVKDKYGQTFTEAVANHLRSQKGGDAEYADIIAEEVYNKLVHKTIPNQLARIVLGPRGPLKERTLGIPYSVIAPWLNNSAEVVLGRYIRSVNPDIRLYDTFGTLDATKAVDPALQKEVSELRKAIQADPSLTPEQVEKRLEALANHEKRMTELLHHAWDGLRGLGARSTLPPAAQVALKGIKAATFTTSLPLVALAQLPDLGAIILKEGIGRTFKSALTTLGHSLSLTKTMSLKEAQAMGQGVENILNSRTNAIFGINDMYGATGKADRALGKFANFASNVFLLNAMTVGAKSIAAGAITTRMIENALDVEDVFTKLVRASPDVHSSELAKKAAEQVLGKSDLRRMAQARISPEDLIAIAGQKKHFEKDGLNMVGNSEKWDDPRAMRAYNLGLSSSVANAVITPSLIDAPMWVSSELGKVIATYKTFMYASYHKIMVAGLQQRDASMFIGFAAMTALGAISLAARDVTQTGGLKDRTPEQWARESIDRSGIASAMFEAENWASMVGMPTSETLIGRGGEKPGQTVADRFAAGGAFTRKPTEQVAGPLGSYANNVFSAIGTAKRLVTGKEITESEVHRATRLIPFRNMMGIGLLVDQLEHAGAKEGLYTPLPPK